ncbi:FAD-dependent monooxygenase [Dictyobacter aurantiacus]|uniref:Oxygenase n=1 Tax=Dictyobacter aurantiacus TaxID=1936993 RepID=A0A401ZKG0_9CHLR|nr:FAD-dependent monooxygenase [Dictyobacter aurantiacus]GCE07351.1 oxygenase [Dictyobacter aurantiacus]
MDTDVLIVGAGPCGLTLAHELLRRGLRPRLIDKNVMAAENTKALGIMSRTLELLTPSGMAEEMVGQGVRVPAFSIYSEGRQLARFDFARHVESAYPYVLMLPQPATEAVLTKHVEALGGQIERGSELVGLEQNAEGVEALLRHVDGSEEHVRARWLIGCDGAHSKVRHLIGATFVGKTFEQSFATGNVHMQWDVPNNQSFARLNRGNFIAYFPMPNGQHRFIIAYKPEEAPTGEITLDEIQRAIDACGPEGARASNPTWLARYQINQRKVDRYLWRHVVLVGDAAHIHSPIAAQGMNTGIQDAFNLGWKLALVAQGKAHERLLESYASERAEVGRQLLLNTGRLTDLALMHQPVATTTRDVLAPHLTRLEKVQQLFTTNASELSIAYARSPLTIEDGSEKVRSDHGSIKAGGRAPDGQICKGHEDMPGRLYDLLNGERHVLLIFGRRNGEVDGELRSALGGWRDWLDVYHILRGQPDGTGEEGVYYNPDDTLFERYGIEDEGVVLIRPDGYIAVRGRPVESDPLRRYVAWAGVE